MSNSATTYPRETHEWIPLLPSDAGIAYTGTFQACLLPYGQRPIESDWQTAQEPGGTRYGVWIGPATPGPYRIWVRITATPEIPVLELDIISIT